METEQNNLSYREPLFTCLTEIDGISVTQLFVFYLKSSSLNSDLYNITFAHWDQGADMLPDIGHYIPEEKTWQHSRND